MKSKYLLLLTLLFGLHLNANSQCKKEIDEFTKVTTIYNDLERIGKEPKTKWPKIYVSARVGKVDSSFFLRVVPEFNIALTGALLT